MNWVKNALSVYKPEGTLLIRDKDGICWVGIFYEEVGEWDAGNYENGRMIKDHNVTHFAVITEPDDAS